MKMSDRNSISFGVIAVSLALIVTAALAEDAPAAHGKKAPIPSSSKQKEAEKIIRDIFTAEFEKTAPADKLALAKTLSSQAGQSRDDPAAYFTLLLLAENLAAQAGSLDDVLAIADKFAAGFEGDAGGITKVNLGVLVSSTRDAATSKLAAAFKTLIEKPDDAGACLLAGKYLCFSARNFQRGLPLLAKSTHPGYSKLAKLDLENPGKAPAQISLGDAWWELAESTADYDEKQHLRERAGFWYLKAHPSQTGLLKVKLEKRIDAAGMKALLGKPVAPVQADAEAPKPAAKAVNLVPLFDTRKPPTSGTWSMAQTGSVGCSTAGDYSRVKIMYEPGSEYDLHAVFVRVSNDGDIGFLINHGGKQGLLYISVNENKVAGICGFDGKAAGENSTRTPLSLESNRDYDLVVQVREKTIRAVLDGKELFKCNMAGHDLSIDDITTGLGDPKSLGLNCHQCLVLFRKIELTELHAK